MGETYGQQVARLRRERGWSQVELAKQSGVSRRTLQDVELDKHERPQRATMLALNKALEIAGAHTENPFADFSDDTQAMLLTVGAYLETVDAGERMGWFRGVLADVIGRTSANSG